MRRKGLRRLEIWLPEVHPIWELPAGRRAEKVRELLDLALRLERGFDTLRQEIAALRDAVRQGEAAGNGAGRPAAVSPDAAKRFLAAFD